MLRLKVTLPSLLICLPTLPVPDGFEIIECGNQCCSPPTEFVEVFNKGSLAPVCKFASILNISPRTIEVGVPTGVTVSVEARELTGKFSGIDIDIIELFSLVRVNTAYEIIGITEEKLLPQGYGIFQTSISLICLFENEVFHFASIPIINATEDFDSKYIVFRNLKPYCSCFVNNFVTFFPSNSSTIINAFHFSRAYSHTNDIGLFL